MHTSLPDFDMPGDEQVHLAAESFRLLADPTRIKVLWALLQGESSVACLAELAGAAPTAPASGLGVGLENVRRRLSLLYGHNASLRAGSLPGGGFEAVVEMPAEQSAQPAE